MMRRLALLAAFCTQTALAACPAPATPTTADLLDCLAAPDPRLRDALGFTTLQEWMRAGRVPAAEVETIRTTLLARLRADDPHGVARPFAALGLAEVARIDRRQPFLTPVQRQELLAAGTAYLAGVRDYRGFDDRDGWRHGVAHGADLMLQLSLNPALDRAQQLAILAAVAAQAAPAQHFYIYGEGARLAAPVFWLARRDALTAADWDTWFAALAARVAGQPLASQATLAMRHNLAALLLSLHAQLSEAQDTRVLPFVTRTLKALD